MRSLSPLHFIGIILVSSLLSTQAVFGAEREDDANQTTSQAVRTLRVQNEQTESTDQYVKSLPLYHVKSLSYPVTWAFNFDGTFKDPNIMFSKQFSALLIKTMLYKPTKYPNGMINVGAPLTPYFTLAYNPVLSNNAKDFQAIYLKPILPFKLAANPLNTSYIDFCSFKPLKSINRNSEIVMIKNLAELETTMKNTLNLTSSVTFGGDSYIPSVYSSDVKDAEFMGLPAKKLTMVFDGYLNGSTERLKYEGVYALKNDYVICGEAVAPEKSFDEFRKAFDAMIKTIVPPYEFQPVEKKSSAASSAKSLPAVKKITPKIPASCRTPKRQKLKRCLQYFPMSSSAARTTLQ